MQIRSLFPDITLLDQGTTSNHNHRTTMILIQDQPAIIGYHSTRSGRTRQSTQTPTLGIASTGTGSSLSSQITNVDQCTIAIGHHRLSKNGSRHNRHTSNSISNSHTYWLSLNLGAIGNRHTRRHRASLQSVSDHRYRPRSQISINAQSQSAITGYQRDQSRRNRHILQLNLKRSQSSNISQ